MLNVRRQRWLRVLARRLGTRFVPLTVAPLVLAGLIVAAPRSSAQSSDSSEPQETVRGTVVNSATHEPIPGALVQSPDSRFATRTDNQGRFEFAIPKANATPSPAPAGPAGPDVTLPITAISELTPETGRPLMLTARKPGFLENNNLSSLDLYNHSKEITLFLVPEAIIAGHVSLPTSEPPDNIQLQLFRRLVQNGTAQWVRAGNATSKLNGDFRFAELLPGTYKLLTGEKLDQDILSSGRRRQLYGYPPVYYPDANDFASAAEIELSPGQTVEPHLVLAKQPYYQVRIAVANTTPGGPGMIVNVASQKGHAGPGYSLGYNSAAQQIEGLLPSGTYVIEARSYVHASIGVMTLVVKDAPATDAKISLQPSGSVLLDVREEFSGKPSDTPFTVTVGQRTFKVRGPRRYLTAFLESADEFNTGKSGFLRPPTGPDDTALQIDDVLPGRYWVRVQSSYGYAASIRAGSTDLLREPLVIGTGASVPIEIMMRDDAAKIGGQVEGVTAESPSPVRGLPPAFVYCVPTSESTGQFAEMGVSPDGTFSSPSLAPGEYRVLAFDRQQTELEYRNPEAMKMFDGRGAVVQIAGGQSEHVTLQVIPTQE